MTQQHGSLFYKSFGFVFLGLAAVGLLLPLVPATPFILLAAACFARSSERWHQWLLNNPTFGPMIRNWERDRCISRMTKIAAILTMLVMGGISVAFAVEAPAARIAGALLMLTGALVVLRLKTCTEPQDLDGANVDD